MILALLMVGLLPASRTKNALLRLLGRGWSIDRTAVIQPVLMWRIGRLTVGARAYIGPGTIFRDVARVEVGDDADIGQFNWVSAAAHDVVAADEDLWASLVLAPHSTLTSRHYVDCSGGVVIERAAGVVGLRSTILSHSLNPRTFVQEARPVRIGASSVVFTNVVLNAGTTVARDCIVASGAVVAGDLTVPGRLYGGVPAREIADTSTYACAGREITRKTPRGRILAGSRRAASS